MRRCWAVISIGTLAAFGAGCATTVEDIENRSADGVVVSAPGADVSDVPEGATPALEDGELIEGGNIDATVPVSTTAITGGAAELLPELAQEMSRLGSLVAEDTTDDESLARIETIWATIRPEIEAGRPELVNGIGATVDMARIAVERTRPADADKAFSILTDLVDSYFGE